MNQDSSRARLQHSHNPPSLTAPNRVITGYSQQTQPAAKHRRPEPHYNADTTRLSGDKQRPPPGEPIIRSGRWTVKGAQPGSGKGKGRGGGYGWAMTTGLRCVTDFVLHFVPNVNAE